MNREISDSFNYLFPFNLISIISSTNSLQSDFVKYLDSMSDIFASQSLFLARLLTMGTLFSTAFNAVAVA